MASIESTKALSNWQSAISKSIAKPTKTTGKRQPKAKPQAKPTARAKAPQASKSLNSRRFHRFDEARGKTLDFVQFYTSSGFHCLDVRFQDRTALTFEIDPYFTVEAAYTNWKTGNMRMLRQWPRVASEGL